MVWFLLVFLLGLVLGVWVGKRYLVDQFFTVTFNPDGGPEDS